MTPYPRNRFIEIIWNFCLFTCLVSVLVPLQPLMPGDSFDDSWPTALNQALAQGLIFGKEITFTFGPLVSLYTWTYHPFTDSMMVVIAFLWAICFSWVLSSLLAGSSGKQRILWLIFITGFLGLGESRFSFLPVRPDAVYFAYPLLLFIYLLSGSYELSPKKSEPCSMGLIFFLSLPLGVFPLIKFSNFLICATLILITTLALLLEGRGKAALSFVLGPILSFFFMLWFLGQPFDSIPDFFQTGFSISSSYTAAMSLSEGPRTYPAIFFVVSVLLLFNLFRETSWSFKGKMFLIAAFSLYLFMSFKAGFTRADSIHIPMSGQALLLAGMCCLLVSKSKRVRDLTFLTFLAGLILVGEYRSINVFRNIRSNLASLKNGVKTRLFEKAHLEAEYQTVLSQIQKKNRIPKMSGPTDIFSTGQLLLIASGNEWAPRPILQGYKTINSYLSELDQAYYRSEKAPQNVLFRVEPIDNRLVSLEESATWPVLLNRYEEVGLENGYLKLKRKESIEPEAKPEQVKLKSLRTEINQSVRIPQIGKPLFVRIGSDLSFWGRVQNIFYKPEELFLQINLKNGDQRKFRFPHEMARGGFLLSPLIDSNETLKGLFAKEAPTEPLAPDSFEIQCQRSCRGWNTTIEVEFYHYKGLM